MLSKNGWTELWKSMPWPFRVVWIASIALQAGFLVFLVWAIYRLVTHFTGG